MPEENPAEVSTSAPIAGATGSLALRDIPIPDYCDVVVVPTGGVEEPDPRVWAEAIFAHENSPLTSRGLRALRDEAVRLFDMVPPPQKEFVADEVVGSEALIVDDDEKLTVRIGVALLPGGELLQVTTAVKYRSVRGRLAFAPRRLMHAAAGNTLARRAPPPRPLIPTSPCPTGTATRSSGSSCTGACTRCPRGPMCWTAAT